MIKEKTNYNPGAIIRTANLPRYAWLSIAAALLTIGLKTAAYLVSNSVGLLSDAAESLINLAGAIMALAMLTIAARPADKEHAFGHSKAEYFSSSVEGVLIFVAAVFIIVTSVKRFVNNETIDRLGTGIIVSAIATLINLTVAVVILRAGKKHKSISLEADAKHLFTDVFTSVGVIAGIGAVALTGWQKLDPVIALVVSLNILWTGYSIIRRSVSGLMDTALPSEDQQKIGDILDRFRKDGITFHAILTRQAGTRQFVSFHVLMPGDWSIQKGHHILENIEADLRSSIPGLVVSTHMEPLEDPNSYRDLNLDRTD
jgi:cation diffusion facilitator family transporter